MIFQANSNLENSIKLLVTQIGNKNAIIELKHDSTNAITEYRCTQKTIIPKNITLRFEHGAVIKVLSSDLFFQGDIQAGPWMIFDGKAILTEYPSEASVDWFKDPQNAIDSGVGNLIFENRRYYITKPLLINDLNQSIYGRNKFKSVIEQKTSGLDIFKINSSLGFVDINNLCFDFKDVTNGGCCINAEMSNNLKMSNLIAHKHPIGIKLKYCNNIFMEYLQLNGGTESALWIEGLNNNIQGLPSMEVHLRDFIFDGYQGSGSEPPMNFKSGAIHIDGFLDACFFDSGDIVRAYIPLLVTDSDGPPHGVCSSPSGLHFSNIYFDSGNIGSVLNYCRHSTFHNCGFTNGYADVNHINENPGLLIDNCESLRFTNCHVYDCRGDGVLIKNTSKRIFFSSTNFSNNGEKGYPGVCGVRVESGTTDFEIVNSIGLEGTYDLGSSQNYGIYVEDGSSDRYIIKNNNLYGNKILGLYDGGTGKNKVVKDNFIGEDLNRPECLLVKDFYKYFLNRDPDEGGFTSYINMFRHVQCHGDVESIKKLADDIVKGMLNSPEYINRNRNDYEYFGDLYNGILGRQASSDEIYYWVNFMITSQNTRNEMLIYFTSSAEFANRATIVFSAGCLK